MFPYNYASQAICVAARWLTEAFDSM